MNAWEILGIEPTQNKREIKKAYAKLIAEFHPEDHPKKFREIQSAYDYVMGEVTKTERSNEIRPLVQGFKNDRIVYGEKEFELNATSQEERNMQYDNNRMYDELNLGLSFPNHQDKAEDMKNSIYEDAPMQIEKLEIENEINMEDTLYNRISERLKYVNDADSLRILLSNQTFFDQMGNVSFYQKVCKLIQSHFNEFDPFAISYLTNVFRNIERSYDYEIDEYSITNFIERRSNRKWKNGKRKKYLTLTVACILLCFVYGIRYKVFYDEKKVKYEKDEQVELIKDSQTLLTMQMEKNKEAVEAYILKEKNENVSCLTSLSSYFCSSSKGKTYHVNIDVEDGVFVGVKSIIDIDLSDKKQDQ